MGVPAASLAWADPPPARTLQQGVELLQRLGALNGDGRIMAVGRRMLELPLHPRLADMVVAASGADEALACVVGALLDERDVFRGRPDELPADLSLRVAVVCGQFHDRADGPDVRRVRERALHVARRARAPFDSLHLVRPSAPAPCRAGLPGSHRRAPFPAGPVPDSNT